MVLHPFALYVGGFIKTLRPWFYCLLCLLASLIFSPYAMGQKKMDSPAKMHEQIMINVAADAIAIYPKWRKDIDSLDKKEIVKTLRNYVDEYAGAQVSTLFYNVNYQRTAYDSKIMTPYWDLPDGVRATEWALFHVKLHKKNVDPFAVCIQRTRERKISPWLSIRMNDHHYWNDSTRINNFILQHPEFRLSAAGFLNYGKKEVRDFYMSLISEALDKYDVDGVELDWIRTNTLFKDGTKDEWIRIINEFMRQARELVNTKAVMRGHPLKIATRVLSTPEISESYGLDGVAWVKNGWTDILITGNWHNPINFDIPVETWRNLIGAGHNYLLIPGADMWYSCQKDPYSKIFTVDLEAMRGFATNVWTRGADGIYLFNHFNRKDYDRKVIRPDGTTFIMNDRRSILTEIGSPKTLQMIPRRHPLTYPDPGGRNKKVETPLPVDLTADEKSFNLYTGPKPNNSNYKILVGLESKMNFEHAKLLVKVNDVPAVMMPDLIRDKNVIYTKTKKWEVARNIAEVAARVMCFKANANSVKPGYNKIAVSNVNGDEQQLIWLEVKIDK